MRRSLVPALAQFRPYFRWVGDGGRHRTTGELELSEGGLHALAAAAGARDCAEPLRGAADRRRGGGPRRRRRGRRRARRGRGPRLADRPRRCDRSVAVAAELEGSRLPLDDVPEREESTLARLPDACAVRPNACGAAAGVLIPVHVDGRVRGKPRADARSDALRRARTPARAARRRAGGTRDPGVRRGGTGDARSGVGARRSPAKPSRQAPTRSRTAEQVTRLAAEATARPAGLLWRPAWTASSSSSPRRRPPGRASRLRRRRRVSARSTAATPSTVEQVGGLPDRRRLGDAATRAASARAYFSSCSRRDTSRARTTSRPSRRSAYAPRTRCARAPFAHDALELERTRALLAVVGQAISQLSLAHTLETAVARVGELLDADRVAVYLRDETASMPPQASGSPARTRDWPSGCSSSTLGPFRSRGILVVNDVVRDPRLASVARAAAEAGIEAAIAVPLLARDEVIGLLAVFPPRGRVTDRERVGAARCARRAARGRRAERAAARAGEAARRRARARARSRAGGVEAGARPLRDLAFVRAEPLARGDARRGRQHRRGRARRRTSR